MAILGIDLGTTNSACAVWTDKGPQLIPNRLGQELTPSVVHIDSSGQISIGKVAKEHLITTPGNTIAFFKRLMGSEHKVQLGEQMLSAEELSALVLKGLKEDAETHLGETIEEAIISVPAYFSGAQRLATKQAGELAGLKVRRLINEPTAAALAFGLHQEKEGHFLILDIGGGTFDVTLIEYFDGIMEVHASAGDNHLGGEDFIDNCIHAALKGAELKPDKITPKELELLRNQLELAKCQLTPSFNETIVFQGNGQSHQFQFNNNWFTDACASLLLRAQQPIRQALKDSGILAANISEVILVGGSSRLAPFRSLVGKMLGRIPASHINPDTAIALGTAVQAGLVAKDQALDDVVLTDVSPYTLGIGIVNRDNPKKGDYFLPIIERNTVIPCSRVQSICTAADKQTIVQADIYQGESPYVTKNIQVGSVSAEVPKGPAGQESLDARISYDVNGLIEVELKVHSTGKTARTVIEQFSGQLSQAQVDNSLAKLSKLKFHPREQEDNRELVARAERLYESELGSQRDYILQMLRHFEQVLESQDPLKIEKARQEIDQQLQQIERQGL
ncbi:MAG: molecular chaperone HscC [Cellvibrionaceae bacterium]|nr:molecular chaperone HscC [Cellvibrionaceae bacterium]